MAKIKSWAAAEEGANTEQAREITGASDQLQLEIIISSGPMTSRATDLRAKPERAKPV